MKYYFVDKLEDIDSIYGNQEPYCMTEDELNHLSKEWEIDLHDVMHEASAREIETYGIG